MTAGLEREAVVGLLPIRALIVHAEDSPQRVENVRRLTAYLAGVGLEAVDVFPAVRPPDPGPLYSAGEFGCYQSYGGCLHAAAAQPEHVITMVIEDDVEFSISAARLREVLEDAVGREWDLLYLGHSGWSPVRSWDRDLLAEPWLQVRGMIYGTTCYMVRPRGFARLADEYDELAWESPQSGGGVGADGAFAELSYRHPDIVRLAKPVPLVEEIVGSQSLIRDSEKYSARTRLLFTLRRRLRNLIAR